MTAASPSVFAFASISPLLREHLAARGIAPADLPLAGIAGSRRAYYRVEGAGLILLVSPRDDADFGRFLRITQFYRLLGVPVPKVYCIDDEEHQVLLEDLGTRRLYDLLRADRAAGLEAYRASLDLLADLQTRVDASRPECPDIASRTFDRAQLLWETTYYRVNYLEGHRALSHDPAWQDAFDTLATRTDAHPKAIMHRDYQSQNLMVKPDGSVHVIDYQGSRHGSMFYDAASLILDPYVMLEDTEVEMLLRHYHKVLGVKGFFADTASRGGMDDRRVFAEYPTFRSGFVEAGLQRIMQALGAYCFLSREKGIVEFATHIPAGETRLRWLIRETGGTWAGVLP
jgi:aminoglycoside/choline kinase family phosphotransferase